MRTVCVWERVCVRYESLMSITMVQCSIKVKSKGQQTCYKKNSQNVTVLSKFGLLANTICSIFLSEWFPLWFPVVIQLGFVTWCWLRLVVPRNATRIYKKNKKKRHPYSDVFTENTPCDHFIQCNYDQIRLPPRSLSLTHCRTNQRKSCTVSCLKQQHRFCAIDLYDRYC